MKYILQLVITVLGSVLGGWIVYRITHPPTVISYQASTTLLGGVAGLLPDMYITIGHDEIDTLYIHSFEFISQGGPTLDEVDPAIGFDPGTRFYGQIVAKAPTPRHHIRAGLLRIT